MSSPLDSIFGAGVARVLFENKRQRDELGRQGTQDTEDFNTMLQRMARQRTDDLRTTNYGANREGLFYSGQLGKRRSNVERGYSERESDSRRDLDRRTAARAQALSDLGTITANGSSPLGYTGTGRAGLDLGDLYNDAVGRQLERDRQARLDAEAQAQAQAAYAAPADGGGGGGGGAPAPAASGATFHAPSAAHGGQMWVYRRGASGKAIPLRPVNGFGH